MFFFFNDTATTEIYTLSLHDALPISTISMSLSHCIHQTLNSKASTRFHSGGFAIQRLMNAMRNGSAGMPRSEERFSRNAETDLVCSILLEKKKPNVRRVESASLCSGLISLTTV